MKSVVVISGKGGTGKTTVTASLATDLTRSGTSVVLADADVDAANLSLSLHPKEVSGEDFYGGEKAVVDARRCMGCGLCVPHCRFGALSMVSEKGRICAVVDELQCEGCAVCDFLCPEQAIRMEKVVTGKAFLTTCDTGWLSHARLGVGGENSGRLVTQVVSTAQRKAEEISADLVLIDGPPGTGCPVIAAVTGVDLVLVVAEPTLAGVSDLNRVLALAGHFSLPVAVVINKADLNEAVAHTLEEELEAKDIPAIGALPYDESIPRDQRFGLLPVDRPTPAGRALRRIRRNLENLMGAFRDVHEIPDSKQEIREMYR